MSAKPKFEDPTFEASDIGVSPPSESTDSPPPSAIGAKIRKLEARLFAIPGVKSVGEGRGPVGDPAIEVGVAHAGVVVPPVVAGIPVITRVIGEVDAQSTGR